MSNVIKSDDVKSIGQSFANGYVDGLSKPRPDLVFPNESVSHFKVITNQMTAIYARKNKDYGNSFDKSLDEDGLIVPKIRLGDKYNRFSQLIKQSAEVKDESIRDTLLDMANYAIMTIMWMDSHELKHDIFGNDSSLVGVNSPFPNTHGKAGGTDG